MVADGAARRPRRSAGVHRRGLRPGRRHRRPARPAWCTERGVVTKYERSTLDADWHGRSTRRRCPGIPSRTRLSPDGTLVADARSSSPATPTCRPASPPRPRSAASTAASYGNLEKFTLVIDGRTVDPQRPQRLGRHLRRRPAPSTPPSAPAGRPTWSGATSATRTLTAVTENAECPSLSPDGTRVAFKVDARPGRRAALGTRRCSTSPPGKRTVLDRRTRSVDDQVEWLDDDTLLYGLPRADEPGVTDVWALDTSAGRPTQPPDRARPGHRPWSVRTT